MNVEEFYWCIDKTLEFKPTLTLDDGTEVEMKDSIAYNDLENDLALAIMHTSWAGATCNVEQVFEQADGTWYLALVYPEKPTKAQIYSGFNGESETSARHIGQVDVDTMLTDEGSGEGSHVEGEVHFGTAGNQGSFDFKAQHCGESTIVDDGEDG